METPAAESFVFGPFRLDLKGGELSKSSQKIPLEPKAFDLLVHFVQNRGRLLRREELLEVIWPDTHVTESSLSRAVAILRTALGDEHDYIETVPRRGYKFVAPVTEERDEPVRGMAFHVAYGLQQFVLAHGENLIGRSGDAAILIRSPEVSRRHARIVISSGRAIIEDLGSRNGTVVRGMPVQGQVQLQDGDEIRLGSIVLSFRASSRSGASMTLPSESK